MKKLRRSSTDRVLFGVCGGLGEYLDLNGDLVRMIWIFLTLFGGVGIIPYIAAFLLLPEPEPEAEAEATTDGSPSSRVPQNVGLALVAVGGYWLLAQFGFEMFGAGVLVWTWSVIWPIAILAVGFSLVWPRLREGFAPASRGKIRRSVSNRILAGVCGGVAEDAGVDANLVRIGFVFASVMSMGIAALGYLLLIFVLPEAEPVRDVEDAEVVSGQAPPADGR